MTHPIPQLQGITPQGLRQLEAWIRRLALPDEPDRWFYVHPLSPATKPPDHRVHEPHPAFQSPWQNASADIFATAFGVRREGRHKRLFIRLAITGGEDLTDSLIFTLPENFRPLKDYPVLARLGERGAATVNINADGTVVYVGSLTATGSGTGGIVAEISSDGTIAITNPTGPTVDVSVNVDDSTIEAGVGGIVQVKDDGITAAKIAAGAVDSSELASTAVTPGSYGDSTHIPSFTVDADGRLTAASQTTFSSSSGIGEILISDTPSTPLIFADLLQNEAQDDLVYADP